MFARRIFIFIASPLMAFLFATAACAQQQDLGGQLQARVDGRDIQLPLMHSDISADVQGDLATVTVVQTFENPTQTPLNATYLFPMNEDAAVYSMTMGVGDELITANIRRSEQARREFEQAGQGGLAALAAPSQHVHAASGQSDARPSGDHHHPLRADRAAGGWRL